MNIKRIITRELFGQDVANALVEKYGAGVTVHFVDTSNCVFSCQAISDKAIRISLEPIYRSSTQHYDRLACYAGDSWTSETTLVGSYQFSGEGVTGSSINTTGYATASPMILGDDFILLEFIEGYPQLMIVGKLTNGKFLTAGFTSKTGATGTCHARLTDDLTREVRIETTHFDIYKNGKYVAQPSVFATGKEALTNPNESFATIPGLLNLCAPSGYVSTDTIHITRSRYWYHADNVGQFHTPLLCIIG